MRILHLCYSDQDGGAAKAAFRLHQAQRKVGLESMMLVVDKRSDDDNVHAVTNFEKIRIQLKKKISEKILLLQITPNSVFHSLNLFSSGILRYINDLQPCIVNLHWLGREMISIKEIAQIKQPIVWTLHDMWAFCGAEHYENINDSDRYKSGYNPQNRQAAHAGLDLDRFVYNRKKKFWSKLDLNIVCPSKWLSECVQKSDLLGHQNIKVISNCIDHGVYRPVDKKIARSVLKLPLNKKKLILFGAMSSTTDPRKGFDYLISALNKLDNKDEVELLVFGESPTAKDLYGDIKTHFFGQLNDDSSLVLLYNSANLFVAPSLQDNLPNTLVESLACGTPCVAFSIGGMFDLISNPTLGGLVKTISADQLAIEIEKQLQRPTKVEKISNISKSIRDEVVIANSYLDVYKNILKRQQLSLKR